MESANDLLSALDALEADCKDLPPSSRGKVMPHVLRCQNIARALHLRQNISPAADIRSVSGCIAAAQYLLLESVVMRIGAERAHLFMPNGVGHLTLCAAVGKNMSKYRTATNGGGIVNAVWATGIAVNLDTVNLDDVVDCPGPTLAENALFFPLFTGPSTDAAAGVIVVINKRLSGFGRSGAPVEPFTFQDERMLQALGPSMCHFSTTYKNPTEPSSTPQVSMMFDPTELHKVFDPFAAPKCPNPFQPISSPEWPTQPLHPQLVYRRDGQEKFIRRQNLRAKAQAIPDEDISAQLQSVKQYVESLESCWHSAVSQTLSNEKLLAQRQFFLTETQGMLHRKQRKLDLVKELLNETIAGSSAARSRPDTSRESTRGPPLPSLSGRTRTM